MHSEAETPLGQFVVDILYKQVQTNTQQIKPIEFEA